MGLWKTFTMIYIFKLIILALRGAQSVVGNISYLWVLIFHFMNSKVWFALAVIQSMWEFQDSPMEITTTQVLYSGGNLQQSVH